MNWKGCGRKRPWANMRRCSDILLKGLGKITETIRFAGLWTKNWTRKLPDVKQVLYLKSRTEELPGAHWTGGWVGPRAGLDVLEKTEVSRPCPDSNPGPFTPQNAQNVNNNNNNNAHTILIFCRTFVLLFYGSDPFWGYSLPVAGVSRQLRINYVKMSAPRPTSNLGISLSGTSLQGPLTSS
jgi:hypothetical protein